MNQFYICSFNYNKEPPGSSDYEDQEIKVTRTSATVIFVKMITTWSEICNRKSRPFMKLMPRQMKYLFFGARTWELPFYRLLMQKTDETFRHIPTAWLHHLINNLFVFTYDEKVAWHAIKGTCNIKRKFIIKCLMKGSKQYFRTEAV